MAKRKKKSAPEKVIVKPKEKLTEKANNGFDSTEDEDQYNFGGLPKRDLKKNLGCG